MVAMKGVLTMKNDTYGRFASIMLMGAETAILLFIIGIYFCYLQNYAAANSFGNYGLKVLTVFGMIAFADSLITLRKSMTGKS